MCEYFAFMYVYTMFKLEEGSRSSRTVATGVVNHCMCWELSGCCRSVVILIYLVISNRLTVF